jgi:DNA repair protein RecN (Recombination protein N)
MASYAERQWVIRKHVQRGRSHTTIRLLEREERIQELAQMLRGESAAEGTRKEALAMLREAQRKKR